MEIPFVFNNIARCANMTGGNKDAYELAGKMSDAWIQFAKTGNPNHKGLPIWPKYNASNTATMHFNNKCEVMPQLDKELFELVNQ
jgi:para-nitrobenzyl esterase